MNNHLKNIFQWSKATGVLLTVLLLTMTQLTAHAAEAYPLVDRYISLPCVYGAVAFVSFILLIGYVALIKIKELNFIFLYSCVLLINMGYFFLSVSKTVPEALMANRISYLGAVFLPLIMLLIIGDVCQLKHNKYILAVLIAISTITFVIAASPGYSTIYYKEVFLVFVNGAAKLKKVYGPMHKWYYVYLIMYYILMLATIAHSWIKKKLESVNTAIFLALLTLLNIMVWYLEQIFRFDFEMLSVSYILTEFFLLFLYTAMDEYRYNILPMENSITAIGGGPKIDYIPQYVAKEITVLPEEYTPVKKTLTIEDIIEIWPQVAELTSREVEVFMYLVANKRRKDIADEMFVTESTVKKHTSNIFRKLDISSRAEIMDRLNNLNY